jgi:hypothetical protein
MLQSIRRMINLITIVGLLLSSAFFTTDVKAGSDGMDYWARWKLELDFTQGQINALWTVFIGESDTTQSPPAMKILAKTSYSISCVPQGTFAIAGNEAIFDGRGYLECKLPSFYHEAIALAKDANIDPALLEKFMEHCECVNALPWVTADLTVDPSESANPVLHEISGAMDFYTPLTSANNGTIQAKSVLRLNGQTIENPNGQPFAWTLQGAGNQIWSGPGVHSFLLLNDPSWASFLAPSFYAAAQSVPVDSFFHWENGSTPLTFASEHGLNITNLETVFTIGYDGANFFVGKMRKLGFDPGCTAH